MFTFSFRVVFAHQVHSAEQIFDGGVLKSHVLRPLRAWAKLTLEELQGCEILLGAWPAPWPGREATLVRIL
jgi:hypothetical protein